MPDLAVFSRERNWNRLGLQNHWRPGKPIFPRATGHGQGTGCLAILVAVARSAGEWTAPSGTELTDQELVETAEQEGHFGFLDDPGEDIYTWEDGEEM